MINETRSEATALVGSNSSNWMDKGDLRSGETDELDDGMAYCFSLLSTHAD